MAVESKNYSTATSTASGSRIQKPIFSLIRRLRKLGFSYMSHFRGISRRGQPAVRKQNFEPENFFQKWQFSETIRTADHPHYHQYSEKTDLESNSMYLEQKIPF